MVVAFAAELTVIVDAPTTEAVSIPESITPRPLLPFEVTTPDLITHLNDANRKVPLNAMENAMMILNRSDLSSLQAESAEVIDSAATQLLVATAHLSNWATNNVGDQYMEGRNTLDNLITLYRRSLFTTGVMLFHNFDSLKKSRKHDWGAYADPKAWGFENKRSLKAAAKNYESLIKRAQYMGLFEELVSQNVDPDASYLYEMQVRQCVGNAFQYYDIFNNLHSGQGTEERLQGLKRLGINEDIEIVPIQEFLLSGNPLHPEKKPVIGEIMRYFKNMDLLPE
jgi:hypothetical protein